MNFITIFFCVVLTASRVCMHRARYDEAQGRTLGQPSGVRLEDGTMLSLGSTLQDAGLVDQQHVFIVFKSHQTQGQKPKGGITAADEGDD